MKPKNVKWKPLKDFPELQELLKKANQIDWKPVHDVPEHKGIKIVSSHKYFQKKLPEAYIYIKQLTFSPIILIKENEIFWINEKYKRVFNSDILEKKYWSSEFLYITFNRPLLFFKSLKDIKVI